jgi:RNA polymerase sigma-70 factor (ECF subfamily)
MVADAQPDPAPDETLVARYQLDPTGAEGSAALAVLVDRWSGRVYGWARRFLREREAALDLAQDCLLRMIQALPQYQPRGKFGAWLFTIVHNRCRSLARPRAWNRDPEIDADTIAAEQTSLEEEFESSEALRACIAAMDSALEPRERAALWMRAHVGMSVEDITRALRIEESTGARAVLQTARRKLKAELSRRGEKGGKRA